MLKCVSHVFENKREPIRACAVVLTCEPERFLVRINFTQPFRGVVHAGDKRDNCRIRGDGSRRYTLPVPLNDCSTTHNVSLSSLH
ncbi:hypothetical protein HPB48_005731 [Haemaphysalis longicornis]|uniref:ZP domain-containing protein n=1 Tax=Haemaphysalis longicornis TaxID=44386 RepID=A0A9J6FBY7_HAELO|nr:hypothetical protein HPB48_005731 [Haemaphysalis longicornis]